MGAENAGAEENAGGGRGKRRQNSRRKILDAARQLFVEKGYHDTRPQDISKLAGVGHGTFYLHFADKRACFGAFVEEAQAEMKEYVAHWSQGAANMEGYIRGVLKGVLVYSAEHPGVITAALADPNVIGQAEGGEDTPKQKALIEIWADEWAEGLAVERDRGAIYSDYDISAVSYAIQGLVLFACRYQLEGKGEQDDVLNSVSRFIVRALKVPESGPVH